MGTSALWIEAFMPDDITSCPANTYNKMTDTDKIKLILHDSKLNNTQFSSKIGITAGALSGILTERTKPTLPILRNICTAFPRINPLWLFDESYDDSKMYLDDNSSASPSSSSSESSGASSSPSAAVEPGMEDVFAFGPLGQSAAKGHAIQSSPTSAPSASAPRQESAPRATREPAPAVPVQPVVDAEKLAASVAAKLQKPARQITEIRIFFDDGTYETFGGH